MQHWVGLPGTSQGRGCKLVEVMVVKFEAGVLAGDKQPGFFAKFRERPRNRAQLDSFRTRTDNKRNTILAQLTP
jgi:hypothetical protein